MSSNTKRLLKRSFYELLETKPVKHITVNDIVDRCSLNRNTFYYHYRDIPSLIEESINEATEKIISKRYAFDSLEDMMNVAIDFIMDHKRAITNMHNSSDRVLYEKYLLRIAKHAACEYVSSSPMAGFLDDDEKAIETDAIACFCFGYIINWLDSGMKADIKNDLHCYLKIRHKLNGSI